jgi:putative ABC transport system substrate-binding protein
LFLFSTVSWIFASRSQPSARTRHAHVEQPTKFELVINLKTARSLGLDVLDHLQQIADEVIE